MKVRSRSESRLFSRLWVQLDLPGLPKPPAGSLRDRSREVKLSMQQLLTSAASGRTSSGKRKRRAKAHFLSGGYEPEKVWVRVDDKGYPIGEDHVGAKYTDADVESARELRREGYTLKEISEMMDMPIRTVRGYLDGSRRSESVAGFKVVKRWRRKV